MPAFRPGLDLARDFYNDIVEELVVCEHTACLLGEGSEVLGYDSQRSTDHAWGPRLQIFVADEDIESVSLSVERGLPDTFQGWPVRFFAWQTGAVRHHVEVMTLDDWIVRQLGFDPRKGITTATWLALPQQRLLQVTQGRVFRDDSGDLTTIRRRLEWYPQDVWLWMMASQWHLIGKTAPHVGRAWEASDRRGAVLVATRLVRLTMEMAFFQERRFWPYLKWFGTAFSRLGAAPTLGPILDSVLAAKDLSASEDALIRALEFLARRHNHLKLSTAVEPAIGHFDVGINDAIRPYRVLNAGDFVAACRDAIKNNTLRELVPVGAFDQLTHADDALVNFSPWPNRLERVYREFLEKAPT